MGVDKVPRAAVRPVVAAVLPGAEENEALGVGRWEGCVRAPECASVKDVLAADGAVEGRGWLVGVMWAAVVLASWHRSIVSTSVAPGGVGAWCVQDV